MIEHDHATPAGAANDGAAQFGAFAGPELDGDSLFRSAETGAVGTTDGGSGTKQTKKTSRRRGGRRRRSTKGEASPDDDGRDEGRQGGGDSDRGDSDRGDSDRGDAGGGGSDGGDSDGGDAPGTRKKRRRSRRKPAKAAKAAKAAKTGKATKAGAETDDRSGDNQTGDDPARGDAARDDGPDDGTRSGTKRRRSRRRKTKTSAGDAADDADDVPDDAERTESGKASADERDADDGDAERAAKKKRRRGTRGGRKRKKKQQAARADDGSHEGPAVIESIPGEEDDLPELPDLPDDAERVDEAGGGRGRKKKKTSRGGRKKKTTSSEDSSGGKQPAKKKRTRSKSSEDADEDEDEPPKKAPARRTQQILVNSSDREEARVAVVEDGMLIDLQINAANDQNLVSDVYRGRVVNIEPSIGAAFIDFGRGKNGFLHTSDVLPDYGDKDWKLDKLLSTHIDPEEWDELSSQPHISEEVMPDEDEDDDASDDDAKGSKRGKKKGAKKAGRLRRRPRLPITDLLKVGQRVVVQVTKDAIGDKGPTLTTYLSIPGRYLVLMPSMQHTGVSRKIEDQKERRRLKRALDSVAPKGMGVIARTAAMGRTKAELKRDLEYLLGAWERFAEKLSVGHGPAPLYQESDVAIKTVRDLFGPETDSVVVDDQDAYDSIREFAERLMPDQVDRIKLHEASRPLFHHYGVEPDYERVFARRIDLPSGGSIVIDQAEALVAIDVNSGKTRTDSHDFEEIALKTNLDAVPEIARQIRLRDLGGILVIDFIDMSRRANMRTVERAFRDAFAGDRARSKLGRISQFGLLEMTRQRLGPGIGKRLFTTCQHCRGLGKIRTVQSRAAAILRRLGSSLTLKGFSQVEVRAHPDAIQYLQQHHADELKELEATHHRKLRLSEVPDQIEDSVLRYLRADGREVRPGGRRKR